MRLVETHISKIVNQLGFVKSCEYTIAATHTDY